MLRTFVLAAACCVSSSGCYLAHERAIDAGPASVDAGLCNGELLPVPSCGGETRVVDVTEATTCDRAPDGCVTFDVLGQGSFPQPWAACRSGNVGGGTLVAIRGCAAGAAELRIDVHVLEAPVGPPVGVFSFEPGSCVCDHASPSNGVYYGGVPPTTRSCC